MANVRHDSQRARAALVELSQRQPMLRTAYAAARYGWPEGPAREWTARPQTFAAAPPPCRVTVFLEALAGDPPAQ
jgi:hypothetical protein